MMFIDIGEFIWMFVLELASDAQGQFSLRFELDLVQTNELAELVVGSRLHVVLLRV